MTKAVANENNANNNLCAFSVTYRKEHQSEFTMTEIKESLPFVLLAILLKLGSIQGGMREKLLQ